MTTAGRLPIGDAMSRSLPRGLGERLGHLNERSGLTWRGLAGIIGVAERDAIPLRRVERSRWGPRHRAIVALARDLPGGRDLIADADDDDDDCYNHDYDGHGG